MYEHIVMFKFNKNISPEKEQDLLRQLKKLKGNIPGIIELTAGVNVTEEVENQHGYTLGLRVTFKDKRDLDNYLPHPIHQEFVSSLNSVIDQVIVSDYQI
ncbi:Dabb family protein [Neobacillus niacini]|uniref:Dabb family protein n=1 Tax=Neobacillus niacini TaxID=86668 RepID=UPI002FFEE3C2